MSGQRDELIKELQEFVKRLGETDHHAAEDLVMILNDGGIEL